MAHARSIQCINRPPSSAPSGLASLGRTISVISDCESRTGRGVKLSSLMVAFLVLLVGIRNVGTAAPGCPPGEAGRLPEVTVSSPQQTSYPASSSSRGTTPENTPPSAAHGYHDASQPIATRTRQTPASHARPDDAHARIRSERKSALQLHSPRPPRFWPQSGLNPTPA